MLKKLLSIVLLAVAMFAFAFNSPALAGDAVNGGKIFGANCAACHAGGNNVIMAQKTLKKDALEKFLDNYANDPLAAVVTQVKNGKNAMPAFGGRLSDTQIEDVATYVLGQADKGWKA